MPRSRTVRLPHICLLALSISLGAGCFFGDDKDSPSEPTGDTTSPEIVDYYPADGATNVDRNLVVWIAFSEPMDKESVADDMTIIPSFGYLTSWEGDIFDITPTNLLDAGTAYTITIGETSMDLSGNELGADLSFTFTTNTGGDVVAPTVLGTSPDDGEEDVPPLQPIEVHFSEPMNLTSVAGSIEIDPYTEILGIEWIGTRMEIYHDLLPQETEITLTISTLATDLAGNHLAAPYTWSFTTLLDDVRPYLLDAAPENGETDVMTSLNAVELTFSEPMNPDFQMPAGDLDARLQQALGETEEPWNEELTTVTLELARKLLPGCTYWARFGNGVTDLSGNVIDPNPTDYEFTTAGDVSYFPAQTNYIWRYFHSDDALVQRKIENFSSGTGTFDLAVEYEISPDVWAVGDIWHMQESANEILHLGRDQYEEGLFRFTMTWHEPIVYLRFPIEDYAGTSWNFDTYAVVEESATMDSLTIAGTAEIEESAVDLTADYAPLHGTFAGCYIHHLYGEMVFYLEGSEVGSDSFHMITWYSPGAGPVKIIEGTALGDTSYVYDWEL